MPSNRINLVKDSINVKEELAPRTNADDFYKNSEQAVATFLKEKKTDVLNKKSIDEIRELWKDYVVQKLQLQTIGGYPTDEMYTNGNLVDGIKNSPDPTTRSLAELYEMKGIDDVYDLMLIGVDLDKLKTAITAGLEGGAKVEKGKIDKGYGSNDIIGALNELEATIIKSNTPDNDPEGNEVVNEELVFHIPEGITAIYEEGVSKCLLRDGEGVTLSGKEKNNYKVQYQFKKDDGGFGDWKDTVPTASEIGKYEIKRKAVKKDNPAQEYQGSKYPSESERIITAEITAANVDDEHDNHGDDSENEGNPTHTIDNRVSGDSPLKEGHKDIATHYQDTDEEKAGTYKADEKAKIKKKQERIRARRDKRVEKLQKKAEKARTNGHEKRAERKEAKAQQIYGEKEIKAASMATKNEVTTRKNVGRSFYEVIHNYKEQNIFTEDVNEDVLKRIPLETWREFNNLFGELLKGNPSDSQKCKDLMSGDALKKKLKSCKDASHLRALKKFWESCTVGQMKVIYEANKNTSDYDVTFMRKSIEFARSDEGKEMLTGSKPEPFYFIADLDKMGNVNTDKVTISGSESQLYSAFLHNCTAKREGGEFKIVDGPETVAVIKQFFNLTKKYNPAATKDFYKSGAIDETKCTLKNFGEFLYKYPDFSVFYVNRLNQMTGGNMHDLFDVVNGTLKAETEEQIAKERELAMDEWNSMEEWGEALDKLMSDPKMFSNLDKGVNTLGTLERHSKTSLMMMLSNALDNQFLQLVTNFFGINGEKDVKIPASVKGQFLAKCRFDIRIFKDLHGFGSHLKGQKIAGGFGLEIPKDAINWLIGEIVPGFVGKLKELKSGCFTLNIPILTAEFAKSLNADRIAQSNARNANAFQELLFDATAGLQFGWKLGKAPLPDNPLVDAAADVIGVTLEEAQKKLQENSSTIAKFFGKEKLVDAMEYVQWVDTEIKNHPVDNAEFPQVFDNTVSGWKEAAQRIDEGKGTKEDIGIIAKALGGTTFKEAINYVKWCNKEIGRYNDSDDAQELLPSVQETNVEGLDDAIKNIDEWEEPTDNEDPEIKAEKEKFERFSANLTLEAGIGYKRDFLRGIEGINSTIKKELDDAIDKTLTISGLTADNIGEKFLAAIKDSKTYENNKDFFNLIADSFKDCITPDVWDAYHEDEENRKDDFKMVLSKMVVGFVEYARADQVRQLDRRTKFTEMHAGIGWHFDLKNLRRKDFFILKFSATVSSFMMKHVENSKKLKYMDASLKAGMGFEEYRALEGKDLNELANNLDLKIRMKGLRVEAMKDGKIKISVDHANAPYILDGKVKTKVKASRVDQMINIHNNGCEAGKDFYYENGELYLGDIKNLSIARRNYLDTQQVYLFLCGAEGKPGVDHTQGDPLPITKDIPKDKDFHNLDANAERRSFKLEEVKNTIEGLKLDGKDIGKEVRKEYKEHFQEVNGKIQFTDDDGNVYEDIQSKGLIFTKDKDGITVQIDSTVDYGKVINIKIIDKTKEGNDSSHENTIEINEFEKTDLGIDEGKLEDNDGNKFDSEDKFFEDRDVGLGLIYLKKRGMTGTDYNDFLNHLGGSTGDDIDKAIQILQTSLKNIRSKFTKDTLSVRGKRTGLGGGEAYIDFKIQKSWYDEILNALENSDKSTQTLLCQRIAGIMAHEELLYLNTPNEIWQGLQFIVKQRGNYYEKLYGPAGKQFPLPGIRNSLIEKFKNHKELLTNKDIVPGLFGYTAYYARGNTLDTGSGGGQTFNPTVMEHTAVLGGKEGLLPVPDDKQEAAGNWLKENIKRNGQEKIIKDMIIKELVKNGKNQTEIEQQLKNIGDILFDEKGNLRSEITLTLDGKEVKITLKTQMVFYLYAACGNESLGLQVEGITIEGGGGGGGGNGNEVTGTVKGDSEKGFAFNVATERQSSTTVVTAEQGTITGRYSKVVDTKKKEKNDPNDSDTTPTDEIVKDDPDDSNTTPTDEIVKDDPDNSNSTPTDEVVKDDIDNSSSSPTDEIVKNSSDSSSTDQNSNNSGTSEETTTSSTLDIPW